MKQPLGLDLNLATKSKWSSEYLVCTYDDSDSDQEIKQLNQPSAAQFSLHCPSGFRVPTPESRPATCVINQIKWPKIARKISNVSANCCGSWIRGPPRQPRSMSRLWDSGQGFRAERPDSRAYMAVAKFAPDWEQRFSEAIFSSLVTLASLCSTMSRPLSTFPLAPSTKKMLANNCFEVQSDIIGMKPLALAKGNPCMLDNVLADFCVHRSPTNRDIALFITPKWSNFILALRNARSCLLFEHSDFVSEFM